MAFFTANSFSSTLFSGRPATGELQTASSPAIQQTAMPVTMSRVGTAPPMATVGIDLNHDGRADMVFTGPDRNHDGIPDALQTHTQHIHYQGTRIPCYNTVQMKQMPPTVLRAHAEHVYSTIGTSVIEKEVPAYDHLLVDWLSDVHSSHLRPLMAEATSHLPSHAVPHAVPTCHVNGVPIPFYETRHLQNLPASVLRVHADHVYKTIGPALLKTPVPNSEHHLAEWISLAHLAHLQPLREQAITHEVPHAYHRGTPIPLYELHHLQAMSPSQLRTHAYHLYNTIPSISKQVPTRDGLLIEWLVEMHERHLNHHLAQLGRGSAHSLPGTSKSLPLTSHAVPHAVPNVFYQGSPIPLYEAHHLQSLPVTILRAHADYVYQSIGPYLLNEPVPTSDHLLLEWIKATQDAHLHPLREGAASHAVPHVYHRGIPLALYERYHLQSLSLSELRAHANHLDNTVDNVGIGKPVPEHDSLLLEWLLEMHDRHLNQHLDELRKTTSTSLPLAPHAVPHAVPHVHYQGIPIPLYEQVHLRGLPVMVLRAHADHLYKTIGQTLMQEPVPVGDHLLSQWVMAAQGAHLDALRLHSVPHSVHTVYHRGVPIPLYEYHHFQSMSASQLRIHALHLYDTIAAISEPVPDNETLLLRWLMEVHNVHLNHHLEHVRKHASEHEPWRDEPLENWRAESDLQLISPPSPPQSTQSTFLVGAQAEQLKDILPISSEDLQSILTQTLLAHGLTATAATLKRESGLGEDFGSLSPKSREVLAPPCMSDLVKRQFSEAHVTSDEQQLIVEECTQRVASQKARLERLMNAVHEVRLASNAITEEDVQAMMMIKQQDTQLEEMRSSAETLDKAEADMKEHLIILNDENARLSDMNSRRVSSVDQLKDRIRQTEERLVELTKNAENCDSAQAQRIRRLLIHWDAPQGPKRIAAETFAHVDSNHDGRLDWQSDEICRFMRLIFHYHHVAVPPWSDSIWSELFKYCDLDKSQTVDVVEAMKFTRGCFEAALRLLADPVVGSSR